MTFLEISTNSHSVTELLTQKKDRKYYYYYYYYYYYIHIYAPKHAKRLVY